jgi:hypothetical protein
MITSIRLSMPPHAASMRLSSRGPNDAHRQAEAPAEDGQEPVFLFREEGAGLPAPGKKIGEAVARQRKACGKPRSIKAAGAANGKDMGERGDRRFDRDRRAAPTGGVGRPRISLIFVLLDARPFARGTR